MTNKRDNSGILFDNDRKEKETHPDFRGWVTVGGVDYWLSGWNKIGNKGDFISLAFEAKAEVNREGSAKVKKTLETPKQDAAFDDDIPF